MITGFLYKECKQHRLPIFLTMLAAGLAAFLPIILVMADVGTIAKEAFIRFAMDGMLLRTICVIGCFLLSFAVQGMSMGGDDRKKWAYFVASGPKGIHGFVCTKYLFIALLCVLYFALSTGLDLLFTLVANVFGGIGIPAMAKVFFVMLFVQLLLHAIEIPFTIRFGAKGGSMIKTGLLIAAVLFLTAAFLLDPAGVADAVSVIMEHGAVPAFMKWLLPVISIAVYALSCLLSCRLYMKGADEYYH